MKLCTTVSLLALASLGSASETPLQQAGNPANIPAGAAGLPNIPGMPSLFNPQAQAAQYVQFPGQQLIGQQNVCMQQFPPLQQQYSLMNSNQLLNPATSMMYAQHMATPQQVHSVPPPPRQSPRLARQAASKEKSQGTTTQESVLMPRKIVKAPRVSGPSRSTQQSATQASTGQIQRAATQASATQRTQAPAAQRTQPPTVQRTATQAPMAPPQRAQAPMAMNQQIAANSMNLNALVYPGELLRNLQAAANLGQNLSALSREELETRARAREEKKAQDLERKARNDRLDRMMEFQKMQFDYQEGKGLNSQSASIPSNTTTTPSPSTIPAPVTMQQRTAPTAPTVVTPAPTAQRSVAAPAHSKGQRGSNTTSPSTTQAATVQHTTVSPSQCIATFTAQVTRRAPTHHEINVLFPADVPTQPSPPRANQIPETREVPPVVQAQETVPAVAAPQQPAVDGTAALPSLFDHADIMIESEGTNAPADSSLIEQPAAEPSQDMNNFQQSIQLEQQSALLANEHLRFKNELTSFLKAIFLGHEGRLKEMGLLQDEASSKVRGESFNYLQNATIGQWNLLSSIQRESLKLKFSQPQSRPVQVQRPPVRSQTAQAPRAPQNQSIAQPGCISLFNPHLGVTSQTSRPPQRTFTAGDDLLRVLRQQQIPVHAIPVELPEENPSTRKRQAEGDLRDTSAKKSRQ